MCAGLEGKMKTNCKHCGTPFREERGDGGFCCSGCRHVYDLIRREGLDGYYELQDQRGRPLGRTPFTGNDLRWVPDFLEACEAEASGGTAAGRLRVRGLFCGGCAWLVERLGRRFPGLRAIRVSLSAGTAELRWTPGAFDLAAFIGRLREFGYRAEPGRGLATNVSGLAWRVVLTGVFAVNSLLLALPRIADLEAFPLEQLFRLLGFFFLLLSLLVGGAYFFQSFGQARRHGSPAVAYGLLSAAIPLVLLLDAGRLLAGAAEPDLWRFPVLVFVLTAGVWLFERTTGGRERDVAFETGGGSGAPGEPDGRGRLSQQLYFSLAGCVFVAGILASPLPVGEAPAASAERIAAALTAAATFPLVADSGSVYRGGMRAGGGFLAGIFGVLGAALGWLTPVVAAVWAFGFASAAASPGFDTIGGRKEGGGHA